MMWLLHVRQTPKELTAGTSPFLKEYLSSASRYRLEFTEPENRILRDPRGRVGALPRPGVPILTSRALELMKCVQLILM